MLWTLFWMFFKIGLVSFGGGYAMIPLIELEVSKQGWLTTPQLTDVIAIAGMSPGPIATNTAVFIGYKVAGFAGMLTAAIAMSLPSLMIILFLSFFFFKFHQQRDLQAAFFGLRPVVTALISYAAYRFSLENHLFTGIRVGDIEGFLLLIGSLCILFYAKKVHPVYVLLGSGLIGMIIYH